MKDRRPIVSSISRRDAAKAAVAIIGLLFVCIALGWMVTRAIRSPRPPNPSANAAPSAK